MLRPHFSHHLHWPYFSLLGTAGEPRTARKAARALCKVPTASEECGERRGVAYLGNGASLGLGDTPDGQYVVRGTSRCPSRLPSTAGCLVRKRSLLDNFRHSRWVVLAATNPLAPSGTFYHRWMPNGFSFSVPQSPRTCQCLRARTSGKNAQIPLLRIARKSPRRGASANTLKPNENLLSAGMMAGTS